MEKPFAESAPRCPPHPGGCCGHHRRQEPGGLEGLGAENQEDAPARGRLLQKAASSGAGEVPELGDSGPGGLQRTWLAEMRCVELWRALGIYR